MASNKKVIIPLRDFDAFSVTPDNSAVNQFPDIKATFRYRIVSGDRNRKSDWSPIYDLNFLDQTVGASLPSRTISQTNGFASPIFTRSDSYSTLTFANGSMMQSVIEKVPSNEQDLFKYSWIVPPTLNVKKFDIHLSWRSIAHVHPTATLSAPSGTGPYTGTITFTGTGAQNSANALRAFYNKAISLGDTVTLYAGANTATPAAALSVVSGTSTNGTGAVFNISSTSTWTATGTVKYVFRANPFTDFQYADSTSSNSYSFQRTETSNIQYARLTKGSNQLTLIPDKDSSQVVGKIAYLSGIVVGMTLSKISGDGEFAPGAVVVSAINYDTDTLTLSTDANGTSAQVHATGGDIVFKALNNDFAATAITGSPTLSWNMPMYVQAQLHASNLLQSPDSIYSFLSVSPGLSTFFRGYGTISGATTTAPFTATISGLGFNLPSSSVDIGKKLYAPGNTGAGSLGGGSVTFADWVTSSRITIHSTAAITNGLITNLQF
jgi:hypothetical protein